MEHKFRFSVDKHQYFINGRLVPNVTSVLRDLIPGWSASDWYLERGRVVHACAALVARGKNFDYDPIIEGQVTALRRFFAEVNPFGGDVELPVYSERYQYGGTLDLLTDHLKTGGWMIVDFKASLTKSLPYQVAAYALALQEQKREQINFGVGVEIHEDGTYKMSKIYDLRKYKQDWLNLLGAYNIRRKCGIKEDAV